MPATLPEAHWPLLRRAARTVVVVDVVESVRLMEQDEDDTVHRWQAFVGEVVNHLLPQHGGRLVKSLGDGLMLEFEAVPQAIQCAIAMQATIAQDNHGRITEQCMNLRIGAHVADIIVDEHDIYGSGVNLAARLTTLAGPGEIVVSAEVRDRVIHGLDADLVDLGECFLKHVTHPVRGFRVGPAASSTSYAHGPESAPDDRPSLAVIPFRSGVFEAGHEAYGEALADEVITTLSRTTDLQIISRLSTTVFRDRNFDLQQIRQSLAVAYVLTGSFSIHGKSIRVHLELTDTRDGKVVWAEALRGQVKDAFDCDSGFVNAIVSEVCAAIVAKELRRVQTRPMATLESYSLMFSAISLMHRTVRDDFARSREILEYLLERGVHHPVVHAWLAIWHVLKVQQGWSADVRLEASAALDWTRRALDADPTCTLAMTAGGFVHCNLRRDFDTAASMYSEALRINPSEPLAWLFTGTLHAFKGEGPQAVRAANKALRLSPLDPSRYFYDSLAASAAVSAEEFDRAIELAKRSLKSNRTHTSTYRALAIAQFLSGRVDEAALTVQELLRLEPGYTVRSFMERAPGAVFPIGKRFAEALRGAGVPP